MATWIFGYEGAGTAVKVKSFDKNIAKPKLEGTPIFDVRCRLSIYLIDIIMSTNDFAKSFVS